MKPDDLRYSCQMALPGFGEVTQRLLQNARVLIIGAGGLGCPAAQYLAAVGIGTLGIADFDAVSFNNLHRQVLYAPADAGAKKVTIACERLQKQNPGIKLVAHDLQVTSQNVLELVVGYDILVDCSDNFDTRYLINDAGVLSGKPVVYGAIYQYEGQVAVWNVNNGNRTRSPNYRDLFPKVDESQIPNCSEGGVIPTLAGVIGCIQANEVIKYITKTGDLLAGKVMIFDIQTLQSRVIKIGKVTGTHISRLVTTVSAPIISAADLKNEIAGNTVELVDVRSEQEREAFNIGGHHVPMEELDEFMDDMDQSAKTVFYCATGRRSKEAVKIIKRKYPNANVFSLAGGIANWTDAN